MKHTIYKSRDFLRPSQLVIKRRRMKIMRFVCAFLLIVLLICSFIFVMRMDFLKIQEISIKGNVSIKTEDLKLSLDQMISGDYLYFLPKNNILIFPKVKILAQLSKNFPRIDTLNVSIEKNALEVNMTERKPHALWCGASFLQSIDPCFFVDSQGFVFSQAPQFDGSSYLKLYGATPSVQDASSTEDVLPDGNQPVPAWQFISEKEYSDVQNFISNARNLGLELSALELSDSNTYKFQIKNNGLLLASRSVDLAETLENLKAGLSNDIFWLKNKKNQKNLTQVEYIDMRYGNKIFYKLSGQ